METQNNNMLTVEATVNAPIAKAWEYWTKPEHITQWAFASDEWQCTKAENDLRAGGAFSSRMEAKDGSFGFDFGGVYDEVRENDYIEYTMGDGRKAMITFTAQGDSTHISETFEAEGENPLEMQQAGWQAIMNNFKRHTEA